MSSKGQYLAAFTMDKAGPKFRAGSISALDSFALSRAAAFRVFAPAALRPE